MKIEGLNQFNQVIEVEIEQEKIKLVKLLDRKVTKNDCYILPGFIDIHVHGGYGLDFMDANKDKTSLFLRNIVKEGTTSLLHSSITGSKEDLKKALNVVKDYQQGKDEANLLGIHTESNFISIQQKGAHDSKYLTPITKEWVDFLIKESGNKIKIITYAPEITDDNVVKYMVSKNIIPSAGHSIATEEDVNRQVKLGLKMITHMFNGMAPFDQRHPTILNAGLHNNSIYLELICDLFHVSKEVVDYVYKTVGRDRLVLITDAIRPMGLKDGEYESGGFDIIKKGNEIRIKETGTIAGSGVSLLNCFVNFIKATNASLDDLVKITSTNASKLLNLKKGEIKESYDADIILLDQSFKLKKTIIRGEVCYEN